MKSIIITTIITLFFLTSYAQNKTFSQEIKAFQIELNNEFSNPKTSPLTKKEIRKFKGHNFYPINEALRIKAKFIKIENPKSFQMKTTTDRLSTYDKYGKAVFEIKGKEFTLYIYQNHRLRNTKKYKDYLFLPFTDLTNGIETYGGGRYIDLKITTGNTIIIDFNKAYSPSCAYNHKYSCPIPTEENNLDISIEAGVKNLFK